MTDLPDWWPYDKQYEIMDCLEGMRALPDKCVDLVLTDPPYGINKEGIMGDDLSLNDYIRWMKDILFEIERISKDAYFIFNSETMLFKLAHLYDGCRLFASCNNFSIMGRGMPYSWSPVVFKIKNNDSWSRKGRNWFISNTANMIDTPKKIGHPTPKPKDVIAYIIGMFNSKIIFDPFLGSGTTLLGARKNDRIGLGFEINPDYEHIIQKRMMEEIPEIERWF